MLGSGGTKFWEGSVGSFGSTGIFRFLSSTGGGGGGVRGRLDTPTRVATELWEELGGVGRGDVGGESLERDLPLADFPPNTFLDWSRGREGEEVSVQ